MVKPACVAAIAASFELIVTLVAIFELCVFMGVVAPGFSAANFVKGGWAGADAFSMAAWPGIVAAINKKKVITVLLAADEEHKWQKRFDELFKGK